jgi:hypothetical protein
MDPISERAMHSKARMMRIEYRNAIDAGRHPVLEWCPALEERPLQRGVAWRRGLAPSRNGRHYGALHPPAIPATIAL